MTQEVKSKVVVSSIRKIEGSNGTLAIADININGEFAINGVTLYKNNGSFKVRFPWRVVNIKGGKGIGVTKEYYDVAFPITALARQSVTDLVAQEWLAKYGDGEPEKG